LGTTANDAPVGLYPSPIDRLSVQERGELLAIDQIERLAHRRSGPRQARRPR
jgi:hypothetical protein